MTTTIQLQEDLKDQLSNLKADKNETYEDVIKELLDHKKKCDSMKKELLKKGYEEMAEVSMNIDKEWDEIDPEWK